MYIVTKRDKDFFEYLLENEVFSQQSYATWEKPDEGDLMPVLVTNTARYTADQYLLAALKSDPAFIRVPNREPNWKFVKSHPTSLIYRLIDNFGVFPLQKDGRFTWFAFAAFYPFALDPDAKRLDGKARVAEAFQLKAEDCVWNVLTPVEARDLRTRFEKYAPRFAA